MPCTSRIPARELLVQASASLQWSLAGEWTRKSLLAWAPVWEPEPRWYSAWLWELEWALVWGPRWINECAMYKKEEYPKYTQEMNE